MKVKVIGKFPKERKEMEKMAREAGLKLSNKPEIIILYGGDGTFLIAERKFPSVPKLLIRKSKICNTCFVTNPSKALKDLVNGKYKVEERIKLESLSPKLLCTNDFAIVNRYPNQALRFDVIIGRRRYSHLIGDGVVIATPFGSGAYYRVITRRMFKKGIGVAFNNLVKPVASTIIDENGAVKVEITRGSAWLTCDNDKKLHKLNKGDSVVVRKSKQVARLVRINA